MPKGKKINIDRNELAKLKQSGKSIQEIADYFGCCKTVINNRLKKYGLITGYIKQNIAIHHKDYLEIFLTQGKTCLIDLKDWGKVKNHSWSAKQSQHGGWYARAYDKQNKIFILMHRLIISAKKGDEIDHANNNGLDNRKYNLRRCSRSENNFNSKSRSGTSIYKGVYNVRYSNTWCAYFNFHNRRIYTDRFDNEVAAAMARDIEALKYDQKFAYTNFAKENYYNEEIRKKIDEFIKKSRSKDKRYNS